MAEIARRGWRASLILPEMQTAPRSHPRPGLKDLLFVSQHKGRRQALPERAFAAFREALEQERARYGGTVKGGFDAAAPA